MTSITDVAEYGSGMCRKPPVFPAIPVNTDLPSAPACNGQPGGSGGGSGTILRGFGAAVSAIKTLIQNPHLLICPLLIAVVLIGFSTIIGMMSAVSMSPDWRFVMDSWTSQGRFFTDRFITSIWPGFYSGTANLLYSVVQTFVLTMIAEFITVFCLVFLMAGLLLTLSSRGGNSRSFIRCLSGVTQFHKPLAGWSFIMALAVTLLFIAGQYPTPVSTAGWHLLFNGLIQSPFNYIFTTNLFSTVLPGDGILFFGVMSFTQGIANAAALLAINVLLVVPTLFVVPLIVLEKSDLKAAVTGSMVLMRTVCLETASCILGLAGIVLAALLASLLFPAIAGGTIAVSHWPPPGEWLAAGLLYVLLLSTLVVIVAAVGGIAVLDLYTLAKTRQIP